MNRINRRFINWIFESTILVVVAALVGHALDSVFHTRAQFLGLLLLAALVVKAWQLIRLYRKSVADSDDAGGTTRDDDKGGSPPT
jgi:F0F1-type ATP synthase assembly protein I